jgi:hypothetical protein
VTPNTFCVAAAGVFKGWLVDGLSCWLMVGVPARTQAYAWRHQPVHFDVYPSPHTFHAPDISSFGHRTRLQCSPSCSTRSRGIRMCAAGRCCVASDTQQPAAPPVSCSTTGGGRGVWGCACTLRVQWGFGSPLGWLCSAGNWVGSSPCTLLPWVSQPGQAKVDPYMFDAVGV